MASTIEYLHCCRRKKCGRTRVIDRADHPKPKALRAAQRARCPGCGGPMILTGTRAVEVKSRKVLATDGMNSDD